MRTAANYFALAVLTISTPAMAAGAGGESPFGGFYAGAMAGIDGFETDTGGGTTDSETHFLVGGIVGYDFTTSGALFGVEAELTESNVTAGQTNLFVAGDEARLGAGLDIYVGVRAGLLMGERALVYAKGGYSRADVKALYTLAGNTTSGSESFDGYRVGIGAEFALGAHIATRFEYRYSHYDGGTLGPFGNRSIDLARHQGTVGLLYRF